MPYPEYRVRLFLSADLVGSTAFKAGDGQAARSEQLHPIWVQEVKDFYRSFPAQYIKIYRESKSSGDEDFSQYDVPKVWKTIGDEIIMVVRLSNLDHLSYCVNAFIRALDIYSYTLKDRKVRLDMKGCGWLAAFPAPNVTIFESGDTDTVESELYDEDRERKSELNPRSHDFLGPEIDAGFRVSKYSQSNQFAMSVGLALCLCNAAYHDLFRHSFIYHGRQELKGVANGNAYPVVILDVERDALNREVRNYERAVTGEGTVTPLHLANFLRSFMSREKLDVQVLKVKHEKVEDHDIPQCFKDHTLKWNNEFEVLKKITEAERKSAESEGEGNLSNYEILESSIDKTTEKANDKEGA